MSLDAVESGPKAAPLRGLVYGVEGIGKSSFAAGAPSPIFLDADDGTARLNVKRFPRPPEGYVLGDVFDAIAELKANPRDYKTVVADTIDSLEPMILRFTCEEGGKSNIEDFGFGKGHTRALDHWRALLAAFSDLQVSRGLNVILLGHAQVKRYANPLGDDYERYAPKIHEKAASLVREWCDFVLFANYDHRTKVDPRTKRIKGVNTDARFLFTSRNAGWDGKNRFGLPAQIPLDFDAFYDFVKKGAPSDDAVKEEIEAACGQLSAESAKGIRDAVRRATDPEKLALLLNVARARVAADEERRALHGERMGVAPESHALAPDRPKPVPTVEEMEAAADATPNSDAAGGPTPRSEAAAPTPPPTASRPPSEGRPAASDFGKPPLFCDGCKKELGTECVIFRGGKMMCAACNHADAKKAEAEVNAKAEAARAQNALQEEPVDDMPMSAFVDRITKKGAVLTPTYADSLAAVLGATVLHKDDVKLIVEQAKETHGRDRVVAAFEKVTGLKIKRGFPVVAPSIFRAFLLELPSRETDPAVASAMAEIAAEDDEILL